MAHPGLVQLVGPGAVRLQEQAAEVTLDLGALAAVGGGIPEHQARRCRVGGRGATGAADNLVVAGNAGSVADACEGVIRVAYGQLLGDDGAGRQLAGAGVNAGLPDIEMATQAVLTKAALRQGVAGGRIAARQGGWLVDAQLEAVAGLILAVRGNDHDGVGAWGGASEAHDQAAGVGVDGEPAGVAADGIDQGVAIRVGEVVGNAESREGFVTPGLGVAQHQVGQGQVSAGGHPVVGGANEDVQPG